MSAGRSRQPSSSRALARRETTAPRASATVSILNVSVRMSVRPFGGGDGGDGDDSQGVRRLVAGADVADAVRPAGANQCVGQQVLGEGGGEADAGDGPVSLD